MRDRAPRRAVRQTLASQSERWWPAVEEVDQSDDAGADTEAHPAADEPHFAPDLGRVNNLIAALDSEDATLPETVPSELRELSNEIDPHDEALATQLRQLADAEAAAPPHEQASDLLWQRMPRFVRFDERARLLESEYDLNAADTSAGTALGNLVRLAELDVGGLIQAINAGETGTVRDIRERANATLATRMEAWQQNPRIAVVLENEGALLRIHVQSGTGPTMAFRERSDGLRQFVALVALTAHQPNPVPPILLIDEVETHLHYNAQADLIEVLTTQAAASQVVYTTHSAACLPQDLGLGVRVVETLGEQTASTVRQNFWQDEHPGLGALLMAMGASSLVYVTLRPAIIAEGGSDLIFLPSLLREAIARDSLGFAVVPGASTTPPERIAGLGLQGVKTVWVLDADDGGRARRSQLIAADVPEDRVVLLADQGDLEIEDLVAPETYVRAVLDYLRDVGATDEFNDSDLPDGTCRRHDAVEAWCDARQVRKPSKIAIANNVIDLVGQVPLLDAARADELRRLHSHVEALFAP
jgi:AAA domain, putative AbiEii toxin, Type IV TA system